MEASLAAKKQLREQRRLSIKIQEENAALQKDLAITRKKISHYETAHATMKRRSLRDREYISNLEMEVIITLQASTFVVIHVHVKSYDNMYVTNTKYHRSGAPGKLQRKPR